MDNTEQIKLWQDRIRIFSILCVFSDDNHDVNYPNRRKVFHTEVKLQKIDFMIRNPDYLSYFLLKLAEEGNDVSNEIKGIVKQIFNNKEPIIRKDDMVRFLYGAYESIDDVIAFLCGIGLIEYSSKKDTHLRDINKHYFITQKGLDKFGDINQDSALKWYQDRCLLINRFFGNYTGEMLKDMQHNVEQYHVTEYSAIIPNIIPSVKEKYLSLYNQSL